MLHLRSLLFQLLLEFCQFLVAVVDVLQLLVQLVAQRDEFGKRLFAMLLEQGVKGAEAFLDISQSLGVEVDVLGLCRDVGGNVLDVDIVGLQTFGNLADVGIDAR